MDVWTERYINRRMDGWMMDGQKYNQKSRERQIYMDGLTFRWTDGRMDR